MPEVTPPRAIDPAARTVTPASPNIPNKTAVLTDFRSLLSSPGLKRNWAHGPMLRPGEREGAQSAQAEGPARPQSAARRHSGREPERDPDSEPAQELQLDPLSCQLACHGAFPHLVAAPVVEAPVSPQPAVSLPPSPELQQLLSGLARRVAWGGDRRKGCARIELSEGALAGATLIVHAEQRSVSVELELPAGAGSQGWEARLTERLEGRGFSARVRVA